MSDLQTTFYIVGIVYMAIMLLLLVAILAAVLVIKTKINHVHQMIDEKVDAVKNVTTKLATVFGTARHFVKR
jgi:hypothetical protein